MGACLFPCRFSLLATPFQHALYYSVCVKICLISVVNIAVTGPLSTSILILNMPSTTASKGLTTVRTNS